MPSMPLALSVHNFISSVGADAGFAALIGLAILVLLYFAHARDTANLHEEAEELAHRLLQAETRLAQLSRQQPAPQAAPAAGPAPVSQAARAAPAAPSIRASRGSAIPAAPAGMGAPALAAATRVVPITQPAGRRAEEPAVAAAQVPAEPVAPAVAAEDAHLGASQSAGAVAASAPVRERRPGPSPATAAGAANGGSGHPRVATPVAGGPPGSAPPQPVAVRTGPRPAAPRRSALPPRAPAPRQSRGGRRFVFLIAALVAVAAIAALVIATAGGGSSPNGQAGSSQTTNAPSSTRHHGAVAFNPSSVTVSVLNGTATNELAHRVAAKLTSAGYKQGTVATAASQTQTATVIAYRPGFRNDALHVATALKLGPASVQAIDAGTQSVACPPPSPCTANVVVTVGADLQTL